MIKSLNRQENQAWIRDMDALLVELCDLRARTNWMIAKGRWTNEEERQALEGTVSLLNFRISAAEAVIRACR